ncbi:hypothetical protein M9435_002387 [Picochlorum sp. BPE23]|nr:hypothetical protein M9435_002387 [Picochlorum sp. BPE23]
MEPEHVVALAKATSLDDFEGIKQKFDFDEEFFRNYRDADGCTALHTAVTHGHATVVRHLLFSHGFRDVIGQTDTKGRTAFAAALKRSDPGILEVLLEAGADVHTTLDGERSIVYSSVSGDAKAVEILLKAGADPNAKTKDDLPLLFFLSAMAAMKAQSDEVLSETFVNIALALLQGGAKPDSAGPGGFTALHVAGEMGNTKLIRALLDHGATPDLKNVENKTPADIAAEWERGEAVKYLLFGTNADSMDTQMVEDRVREHIEARKQESEALAHAIKSGDARPREGIIPGAEDPSEEKYLACKSEGNKAFVSGDFSQAYRHYQQGLRHKTDDSTLWSNAAAASLRLKHFEDALTHARMARTVDAQNVKAWYREGQAAEGLSLWEDAAAAYYEAFLANNEVKSVTGVDFAQLVKDSVEKGRKQFQLEQRGECA